MFAVGSKVVHPCHGAGTIVNIQEKCIGESTHIYYIIETVAGSMRLMVPVQKAEDVGLRCVGGAAKLQHQLLGASVAPADGEIEKDFRQRQVILRELIKSGSFAMVADAVRQLYFINSRRPLGLADRQMFDQGKEILAGELALATDQEITTAKQMVADQLAEMLKTDEA